MKDIPHAFAKENLDTTPLLAKKTSIDELFYNPRKHFYYHGVKHATLEFMHYFKTKRGRAKDLRHTRLIEEHFASRYE